MGGPEEIRTLDLVCAKDALYQLSYRPMVITDLEPISIDGKDALVHPCQAGGLAFSSVPTKLPAQ